MIVSYLTADRCPAESKIEMLQFLLSYLDDHGEEGHCLWEGGGSGGGRGGDVNGSNALEGLSRDHCLLALLSLADDSNQNHTAEVRSVVFLV